MPVDLNLLVVFQILMSELSVTKAASRLGLSQAAVSASLKRLRAAYGDPLFLRTQRGLRPTPRAVVLQPAIDEALGIIRGTLGTADGDAADRATVSVVRLGLSDDFEMAFGARLIERTTRLLPQVRLVLRQTNSLVAAQALHDRDIDLALFSGAANDGRLRHQSLGSSDYLIVFDPSRRAASAPFSLDEYVAREHVLISYSGLTGIVDDVLAEHGRRRRIRAASTHFSALPFLLRGSDAVATLPSHAARALCELGLFAAASCPVEFPRYAFGLTWRFDALRHKAVGQVRDVIIEMFSAELAGNRRQTPASTERI